MVKKINRNTNRISCSLFRDVSIFGEMAASWNSGNRSFFCCTRFFLPEYALHMHVSQIQKRMRLDYLYVSVLKMHQRYSRSIETPPRFFPLSSVPLFMLLKRFSYKRSGRDTRISKIARHRSSFFRSFAKQNDRIAGARSKRYSSFLRMHVRVTSSCGYGRYTLYVKHQQSKRNLRILWIFKRYLDSSYFLRWKNLYSQFFPNCKWIKGFLISFQNN